MASGLRHCRHVYAFFLSCLTVSCAQTISTSTAVPPLQWINLTGYLQGPAPPPLMDASIGYDTISRNLLIFGGESEGGFVQSDTYLLNLATLVWSKPSPPANLQTSPSPRSAALSGDDFAASNRHAHVLIGGKNANSALSDVWEFDYINQFWAEVNISPGGPSPRWGASGGIDTRVAPINDPSGIPGPNNTIYFAGGTDDNGPIAISDIWELHLSGTLSSNLPNSSEGSWKHSPIGNLPTVANQAGTVVGRQIIVAGGCNNTSTSGDSCALQDSYVLNTGMNSQIAPGPCPAPRLGAALAQNFNGFSSTFSSQAFLLLGTFNDSLWDDGGGLQKGEVAVLDVNAGTWSRILPSGDPGVSGNITFPSPREGAAVMSFSSNLVGDKQITASDTIVFGGRDASGNYLAEVWLLRAYNGAVTSSGQKWSGFGGGKLQTGVNADGAGVTVQYMTVCASAVAVSSFPSSPTSTPKPTSSGSQLSSQLYDVSITHKILAPVSVALLLPAIILLRFASPPTVPFPSAEHNIALVYIAAFIGAGAYGVGIAGLVSSFTTIEATASIRKRSSSDLILKTDHGIAGLALFVCLYGLIPFLYLFRASPRLLHRHWTTDNTNKTGFSQGRDNSTDTREKLATVTADSTSVTPSVGIQTPPASPRRRIPSWGGYSLWQGSQIQEPRASSDTESTMSVVAQPRPFEVVNRPQRIRRASTNGLNLHPSTTPRSLGDLDWLDRRRSLNAVGELDYALSQASRTQGTSPATADLQSQLALMAKATEPLLPAEMPHLFDIILHIIFHLFLLALCILSLVALWSLTSRASFAVFLTWTLAFYVSLFLCGWYGRPHQSILTAFISRLRPPSLSAPQPTPNLLPSSAVNHYPFPTDARGPYIHHQPPYRAAGTDDVSITHRGPRSIGNDEEEEQEEQEDVDEDIRQQRIEEEMARRDVSIITVPRKKLWITNPEPRALLSL